MKPPAYTIRTRRTPGAPYTVHSIVIADGRTVHEQLSPYGAGEAEARVRDFLAPASNTPPPRFVPYNYSRPGGRKGRRGEAWRDHSWLDQPEDV